MKTQKIFMFLITLVISLSMVACSNNGGSSTNVNTDNTGNTDNSDNVQEKDDYPNKSIEWIIPFSAGSGADIFARTLIKVAEKHLGQTIVPINKEGGSTAVGVTYVLSKPADGYTLFSHSSTLPLTIASGQIPFKGEEIVAINSINADIKVLAVNAKSDIKTYEDFVNQAKADPGGLKVGGVGTKSWSDVFYNKIITGADIEATYVPYDGGSKVVASILGENIDAIVITSSNINSQVDAGEIRMLAISSEERDEARPDVPTFKELGLVKISDDMLWRGVFGKEGIPQERLDIISEAFKLALEDPEWKEYMAREQQKDFFQNPEDFTRLFLDTISEGTEIFSKMN